MEAVSELNLKRSFMRDLLTDVPFLRKVIRAQWVGSAHALALQDIITLQDPNDLDKWNLEK